MKLSIQGNKSLCKDNLGKINIRTEEKFNHQHQIFKNIEVQSESSVKASYKVAEIIAKKSKPFSDGEFINASA